MRLTVFWNNHERGSGSLSTSISAFVISRVGTYFPQRELTKLPQVLPKPFEPALFHTTPQNRWHSAHTHLGTKSFFRVTVRVTLRVDDPADSGATP